MEQLRKLVGCRFGCALRLGLFRGRRGSLFRFAHGRRRGLENSRELSLCRLGWRRRQPGLLYCRYGTSGVCRITPRRFRRLEQTCELTCGRFRRGGLGLSSRDSRSSRWRRLAHRGRRSLKLSGELAGCRPGWWWRAFGVLRRRRRSALRGLTDRCSRGLEHACKLARRLLGGRGDLGLFCGDGRRY